MFDHRYIADWHAAQMAYCLHLAAHTKDLRDAQKLREDAEKHYLWAIYHSTFLKSTK